jgi:hypothetical protein
VVGVLAAAALPVAIATTRLSARFELKQSVVAIPVAALLGFVAIVLAGRARRGVRSLRPGRGLMAGAGRVLGVLGLCFAFTASISVGFYQLLVHFQ